MGHWRTYKWSFIVQARPETIHSQRNPTTITEYKIEDENRHDKLLLKGGR
jgi:pyruvate,water dikinase